MKPLGRRSYEVETEGRVYIQNRMHLGKYQPSENMVPGAELPEITEETTVPTDKEETIFPENYWEGRGSPPKGRAMGSPTAQDNDVY